LEISSDTRNTINLSSIVSKSSTTITDGKSGSDCLLAPLTLGEASQRKELDIESPSKNHQTSGVFENGSDTEPLEQYSEEDDLIICMDSDSE